jgi:hypothetical protein
MVIALFNVVTPEKFKVDMSIEGLIKPINFAGFNVAF